MKETEERDTKHSIQAVPKESGELREPKQNEANPANAQNTLPPDTPETRKPDAAESAHYTAQKLLQAPFTPWLHANAPFTSLRGKRRLCARLQKLPWLLAGLGLGAICFALSYSVASHFLFTDTLSSNLLSFGAFRQLLYGLLSRGKIVFPLLLFAFVAGVVTMSSFLFSWLAQKLRTRKQQNKTPKVDDQAQKPYKWHALPLLDHPENPVPDPESQESQPEKSSKARQEKWETGINESELKHEQTEEQTEQEEHATQTRQEPLTPHAPNRNEEPGGQFPFQLQFLLGKKAEYRLQKLLVSGSSLLGLLLALVTLPGLDPNMKASAALLFGAGLLWVGSLCAMILRNQYKQGMESRFQSALQQLYHSPGPSNAYSQLSAVHTLYALAFVEAGNFQQQVLSEFQNILKLTRSSWYQSTYSNYPSVLVEEVLRRLLSAVDFRQFLPGQTKKQKGSKAMQLWQKWRYYRLFLHNFQTFRAFCEGSTVSLLSQIPNNGISQVTARSGHNPRFILKNYYLVGINLSGLRIQEAHFQNCQLSHSNWTHSDVSDCSLSSCLLDQAIFYRSAWRRFLWNTNTARELELEDSFLLQGNIERCNLQGTQSRRMGQMGKGWSMQHCLLRECRLSHSIFLLDNWQGVTASGCEGYSTLLSLRGRLFHWEQSATEPAESGAPNADTERANLGRHLEIKVAKN